MSFKRYLQVLRVCLPLWFILPFKPAMAHGGVVLEDDLCVIRIDFLTAHFTVYQPQSSNNEEFCEELPDVTGSVFVMEYLHDFLRQMPVEFRIVRDVNDAGVFAKWEDIEAIEDLEAATVFYQPPRIQDDGNYTAEYAFEQAGTYIGVVTASHPVEDKQYNAVFYFQVGGPDYGTIPLFAGLLILLQLGYWLSNDGWNKLSARLSARANPHES